MQPFRRNAGVRQTDRRMYDGPLHNAPKGVHDKILPQTYCKQRWTLGVIHLRPNYVDIAFDGVESRRFNLPHRPHVHLAPPLGLTSFFSEIFGTRKLESPGLSCGIVCVIDRFNRTPKNRQTHDYSICRARMASRGHN